MDTRRILGKLEEARHHLRQMREESAKVERGSGSRGSPREFGFSLSAFLNAAYSVVQYLKAEAVSKLKGVGTSGEQAEQMFDEWEKRWGGVLAPEERQIWRFMKEQRRLETHREPAKTVPETKLVTYKTHFEHRGHSAYGGGFIWFPPGEFGDPLAEEKRKRGLPSWATGWWDAQVHHFEIEGKRQDVVQTCERYVQLLERLVSDFARSGLVPASP